jgi:metal-dependent hydrolase (beta-lactamase superfamily II)
VSFGRGLEPIALEPTDDALGAEHGVSALVTVNKAGRERRVLFDAG